MLPRRFAQRAVSRGVHVRMLSSEDASRPFPAPYPTRPVLPEKPVTPPAPESSTTWQTHPVSQRQPKAFDIHHHFDTYNLVQTLEKQGMTRSQAHVFMIGIKHKLRESSALVSQDLLQRSDLDNDSYLYRAALSELRTEIQLLRRNDTQMLQSDAAIVTREVEALGQKLKEDIALMKNEIAMDMNNRKNETSELQKDIDMRIQEINNRLTIVLGDMRTEIEAIRWETIWKALAGVAVAALGIAGLGFMLNRLTDKRELQAKAEKYRKMKQMQEEARHAGTADMEIIY